MGEVSQLLVFFAGEQILRGDILKVGDCGRVYRRVINLEVRQFLPILVSAVDAQPDDKVGVFVMSHGDPPQT